MLRIRDVYPGSRFFNQQIVTKPSSATLPDTDPDLRPLPALLLFSNKAVSTLVFLYLDSRRVHTLLQMWIRSLQTRFA
jgi:hypothetical protein